MSCFSAQTLKPVTSSKSLFSNNNKSNNNSMMRSSSLLSTSTTSFTSSSSLPSREEELREMFRHFDSNGDGKISAAELRAYFNSVGEYMSDSDAESIVADLDSDGDGMLGLDDFVRMMENGSGDGGVGDEDLKKVFEMFEHEKGSGKITPEGLQRMLGRLGDSMSYGDCVAMIRMYDIDGDGEIDFNEFHRMMMC